MPHNIRLFSDVGAKMSMFDNQAKQHKENQMINPFSDWDGSGTRRKLSRDDPDYGKPLEGSKTAERGRQAQVQMIADMVEMCDLIHDCGVKSPDGRGAICFGDVFRLYNAINDKCVGLLMRGRKHNILDFEGEMLFQRRDDHKMIELLLPLNTIRHKYGMHERAGCGEVRPDLIEELERQQLEKQPARTRSRSMETLGLPPPSLHKSRSMELARDAAKSDDAWHLSVDTPNVAGRMGHSAENLTQIVENEGALSLDFTAVPEGAVGGQGEGKDAAADENDGVAEVERENDSASGATPVKWELGSDDEDETQVEEKQEDASAAAPAMWPEVKIVVEDDEDVTAGIAQNDSDSKEVNAEQGNSDKGADKANEKTNMEVVEASEQAPPSDTASLAPEAEADTDSRTSPEHDFWSSTDENNDKSGIKSTEQAPLSKPTERATSPSETEADAAADKTATGDDASHAGDVSEDNSVRAVDQQNEEKGDTSAAQQSEADEKTFSFWDVPNEDEETPGDSKHSQSSTSHCETNPDEQDTKKDSGFSFWDVTEDDETSEKIPKVDGAERTTDDEINDCGESSITNQSEEEEIAHNPANATNNEEQGKSKENASDLSDKTTNDAPATNGEGFSFWHVSDEENPETTSALPKSKTSFRDESENEDTAKSPVLPETKPNQSDNANTSDSTCRGRVPSLTGTEWDATSAEHPSPTSSGEDAAVGSEDQGRVSPRPLAVPPITLSDDSELMPAR